MNQAHFNFLSPLESISFSQQWMHIVNQWDHNKTHPVVGSLSSRLIGTPGVIVALSLDTLTHGSLACAKIVSGLFVSPYNFVVKPIFPRAKISDEWGFSSGAVHLALTINHLFHIVLVPFLTLLDPGKASAFLTRSNQALFQMLKEKDDKLKKLNEELEIKEEEVNKTAQRLNQGFQQELTDLTQKFQNRIDEQEQIIQSLENSDFALTKLNEKDLQECKNQLKALEKKAAELVEQSESLKEELKDRPSDEAYHLLEEQIAEKNQTIEELEIQLRNQQELNDQQKLEINDFEREIEKNRDDQITQQNVSQTLELLKKENEFLKQENERLQSQLIAVQIEIGEKDFMIDDLKKKLLINAKDSPPNDVKISENVDYSDELFDCIQEIEEFLGVNSKKKIHDEKKSEESKQNEDIQENLVIIDSHIEELKKSFVPSIHKNLIPNQYPPFLNSRLKALLQNAEDGQPHALAKLKNMIRDIRELLDDLKEDPTKLFPQTKEKNLELSESWLTDSTINSYQSNSSAYLDNSLLHSTINAVKNSDEKEREQLIQKKIAYLDYLNQRIKEICMKHNLTAKAKQEDVAEIDKHSAQSMNIDKQRDEKEKQEKIQLLLSALKIEIPTTTQKVKYGLWANLCKNQGINPLNFEIYLNNAIQWIQNPNNQAHQYSHANLPEFIREIISVIDTWNRLYKPLSH